VTSDGIGFSSYRKTLLACLLAGNIQPANQQVDQQVICQTTITTITTVTVTNYLLLLLFLLLIIE
jgi:hypothetical protein